MAFKCLERALLRGQCLCVLVVSLFLTLTPVSPRANLDVSEPIVRRSPASDEDLFGFAVLLHQVEEPEPRDIDSFLDQTR